MLKQVPRLTELLTDSDEIRDFLSLYGVAPPAKTTDGKKALEKLLDGVSEEALLIACFTFAGNFATMAQEVCGFCSGFGITGQVQLRTSRLDLPPSGLDTGWVFAGPAAITGDAQERIEALAGAVEELAGRLDPGKVVASEQRTEVTNFGRQLRRSKDPLDRLRWRSIAGSTRRVSYASVREADRHLMEAAANEMTRVRTGVPLPPLLAGAFDLWDLRYRNCQQAMQQAKTKEQKDASGYVRVICAELAAMAAQACELAEDSMEAVRAREGFADFVKTDFWFQRWRIYELWILVRVLEVLRRAGGETRLRDDAGVWRLQYGRDTEPVASSQFPGGRVDLLYQFWEQTEDEEGADMPDIVLRHENGDYIAVIDPKHGTSYRRNKVDKILRRYYSHFDAVLTAMVNYYPMPSYAFSEKRISSSRLLLASGIAPAAANVRRLELNLEDALLERGLYRRTAQPAPAARLDRVPPKGSVLVYLANEAREVDEPAGAWSVPDGKAAAPISGLGEYLNSETELFEASPDGDACLIAARGGEWTLLRVGANPARIETLQGVKADRLDKFSVRWNANSTLCAIRTSGGRVWIADLTATAVQVDAIETKETVQKLGWTAGGGSLICVVRGEFLEIEHQLKFRRIPIYGLQPGPRIDYPFNFEVEGLVLGDELDVFALTPESGTLIYVQGRNKWLRLSPDESEVAECGAEGKRVESVSPGGRFRLASGPCSLKSEDGVQLLQITEAGGSERPLVRFTGERDSPIRWSADGTRFAFLARLRDDRAESRLLVARVGARYAQPAALSGQNPGLFAWLSPRLLQQLQKLFTGSE
jgi:hypothetical protein